jgi:hypothetical protein
MCTIKEEQGSEQETNVMPHGSHEPCGAENGGARQSRETAESVRMRGNELLKRGYVEDAEVAYTRAIELVGDQGDVSSYLNRALARLKLGVPGKCLCTCILLSSDIQCFGVSVHTWLCLSNHT